MTGHSTVPLRPDVRFEGVPCPPPLNSPGKPVTPLYSKGLEILPKTTRKFSSPQFSRKPAQRRSKD